MQRWPELAVTEEAFHILRNEPLLPLGPAPLDYQDQEGDTPEETPLLLSKQQKWQQKQRQKEQEGQTRAGSVLDALLMRIRIYARTTPTVSSSQSPFQEPLNFMNLPSGLKLLPPGRETERRDRCNRRSIGHVSRLLLLCAGGDRGRA